MSNVIDSASYCYNCGRELMSRDELETGLCDECAYDEELDLEEEE